MSQNDYIILEALTGYFPGAYRIVDRSGIIRYVGSSKNVKNRVQDHITALLRGKHDNHNLQIHYDHHGKGSFKYYYKRAKDREEAYDFEQQDLDKFMPLGILYNRAIDARVVWKGLKFSQLHRKHISEGNKGKKQTPEHIAKVQLARKGFKHTEETKQKLSTLKKGKRLSLQHRLSIASGNKGRIVTEETRSKISKSNTGKVNSPEKRAFLSKINKGNKNALGYKHTPEALEKMRLASTGRIYGPEVREKVRQASLGNQYAKGFKHSKETCKKWSDVRRGKINCITVSIDGIEYTNLRIASEKTGIKAANIHYRCKSKNFPNYKKIRL